MEALEGVEFFGIAATTWGIWFAAGLVAGALLMGRRPLGFLGDLIIGVAGGMLGGWATGKLGVRLANYIGGLDEPIRGYLGDFLTALAGAIIVLLVLRLLIRRR
ncbi:MAG: hypothetical protein PVI23_10400 [Maricaulaceae bacterium]|jgi:uncharacterized membrane protein YeaQ/YmgE (transglycosylase-associated protein family)